LAWHSALSGWGHPPPKSLLRADFRDVCNGELKLDAFLKEAKSNDAARLGRAALESPVLFLSRSRQAKAV
jgi:hypothetical protein